MMTTTDGILGTNLPVVRKSGLGLGHLGRGRTARIADGPTAVALRIALAPAIILFLLALQYSPTQAAVGAAPNLNFPFPEGQTWQVSQAYHDGYNLDLQRAGYPTVGEPIRAAADGEVVFAGCSSQDLTAAGCTGKSNYGIYVRLSHGGGYTTVYAHLSAIARSSGRVTQGETIGYAGCTGACTGPHIHFGLFLNSNSVPSPICGISTFNYLQRLTNCRASWHFWEPLAQSGFKGDPAVASWGNNRLDVFVRGFDNGLYHGWWDGARWNFWERLAGSSTIASNPVAVAWGPHRIDVFARGHDNRLYHGWWDGRGWYFWEPLGGSMTFVGDPAVASWGQNRLDVFVRGTDSKLYHGWWDGSRWNFWEPLGNGATFASDPEAVSWGPNRIDVFVTGNDRKLSHGWWDGARWSFWEPLGNGATFPGEPHVASWGANRLDVFMRGYDSKLYHGWWDGRGWNFWEQLGSGATFPTNPTVVSWGSNRIEVFVGGADSRLKHGWWGY